MPTVVLSTNVASDKVTDHDLAKDLSRTTSQILGKPESYVMVHVLSSQTMIFGGSSDPCAFVRLVSIGALSPETNASLSSDIAALVASKYSVPANRLYVEFVDVKERFMFGWNGGTF